MTYKSTPISTIENKILLGLDSINLLTESVQ